MKKIQLNLMLIFNTEKFIEESKLKHPNKNYDYSKFIYVNSRTKGIIICSKHGEFDQNPNSHLSGNGCKKCSKSKKITLEFFLMTVNKIFNNKYDYSNFILKNIITSSIIFCPVIDTDGNVHGNFSKTPRSHLKGSGCYECLKLELSEKKRGNTEEFIKKANLLHGEDRYNYTKTVYGKNRHEPVIIICPILDEFNKIHGEFPQTPDKHLTGCGCTKCGRIIITNARRNSTEDFIRKAKLIHGEDKYDYTKSKYGQNNTDDILIICKKHGEFFQAPANHLSGRGCNFCCPIKKKNEKLIKQFLIDNNIEFIEEYNVKLPLNITYSRIDFYIPLFNLFIEYNGYQHYESSFFFFGDGNENSALRGFARQQLRDEQLKQYCKNNNINLLEIDGRIYWKTKLEKFLKDFFINIW